jgi:hypothetical protein
MVRQGDVQQEREEGGRARGQGWRLGGQSGRPRPHAPPASGGARRRAARAHAHTHLPAPPQGAGWPRARPRARPRRLRTVARRRRRRRRRVPSVRTPPSPRPTAASRGCPLGCTRRTGSPRTCAPRRSSPRARAAQTRCPLPRSHHAGNRPARSGCSICAREEQSRSRSWLAGCPGALRNLE